MSRMLILAGLLLTLCLPLAGGCALHAPELDPAAPTAADLELQGDELLAQGRREAAFVAYAKALVADPGQYTARFKQGQLYADRNMPRQALEAFSAVLEERPEDLAVLEAAGRAAFEAGDREAAENFFRRALAGDGQRPEPHVFLGVLASRAGEHVVAEAEFRAALALQSDCAEALNGLGLELLAQGQPGQAVDRLVAALRAGAPVQRGFNNLGLALVAAGRDEDALAAFTRASGEAGGYNNLGLALLGQGRAAEAAVLFQRAADISPTYYERAHRNLEQARLDQGFINPAPQHPGPVPAIPVQPAPPGVRAVAGTAARNHILETDLPAEAVATSGAKASAVAAVLATGAAARAQAAPAKARQDPSPLYGVHLASFREAQAKRAEALAEEYGRKGVAALVYPCIVPGKGDWLRVVAGPFPDFDRAVAEAGRLRADLGLDYARVVRLGPAAPGAK